MTTPPTPETLGEALPREMAGDGPTITWRSEGYHFELTCWETPPGGKRRSCYVTEGDLKRAGFVPSSCLAAAESKLTEQIQANEALMAANNSLAAVRDFAYGTANAAAASLAKEIHAKCDMRDRAEKAEAARDRANAMHSDLLLDVNELSAKVVEQAERLTAERAKRGQLETDAWPLAHHIQSPVIEVTAKEALVIANRVLGIGQAATPAPPPFAPEPVRDGPFCAMCPSEKRAPFPCSEHPQAGPGYIDRAPAPAPTPEGPALPVAEGETVRVTTAGILATLDAYPELALIVAEHLRSQPTPTVERQEQCYRGSACQLRTIALLRQKLAAFEREGQCLAKLAAWSNAAPGNRFEFVNYSDEWSLCAITEGGPVVESADVSSPAQAVIDLATKLGLGG